MNPGRIAMVTCRRVRVQRRKVVMYLVAGILWWLVNTYCWPLKIRVNEDSFTERSKCPACFGTSLCSDLQSGDIHLSGYSAWTLARVANVKNVFYGFWVSRNISVVVKKLGYDSELVQLDQHLCELVHLQAGCDVGLAVQRLTVKLDMTMSDLVQGEELVGITDKSLHRLDWEKIQQTVQLYRQDWAQCAGQDKLDYLVQKSGDHPSAPLLPHLLTMLLHNQEPVLSMAFPPQSGWPFSSYLGSCGRLAVFTYAGRSLATFLSSPWPVRAGLALQLLKMATMLSKNSLALAIYPTDWAAENFAVDHAGVVRLVDMENIVLVNQTMLAVLRTPGWDRFYTSDNYGCPHNECFSFSIPSLCSHAMTDHNYHAVCGSLLSPSPYSSNLLHSIPQEVVARQTLLPRLLDRCWRGGGKGGRKEAAKLLEDILTKELDG